MSGLTLRASRILRGRLEQKLGRRAFGDCQTDAAAKARDIKAGEALISDSPDPRSLVADRDHDADAVQGNIEDVESFAFIPTTKGSGRTRIDGSGAGLSNISIIIPTHNDFDVLPRAIDSVLNQSYKHFEIIVVDDASEHEVGRSISEKYRDEERIRVHRHPVNKMLGGARNSGIEVATGDFIFFLDADDKLLPNAIETLVSVAVAKDADIVQGGSVRGNADARPTPYHAAEFISHGGIDGLEHFAAHRFASVAWNKLYRRSFLISSGIRFRERYMHEDVAFAAQAAFHAKTIVSVPDPVIQYVINTNSLTRRLPSRSNIESYFATYSDLLRVMTEFGLMQDSDKALMLRVLHAHGSSDFGPKLIDCYSKMGAARFESEFLSAVGEHFGGSGLAAGDLIVFFIGQIARRESPHVRTWLFKRAQVLGQLLGRVLGIQTISMTHH